MTKLLIFLLVSFSAIVNAQNSYVDTYFSKSYSIGQEKYYADTYIMFNYNNDKLISIGLMAEGTSDPSQTIMFATENTYTTIDTVLGAMQLYKCTSLNNNSYDTEERFIAFDINFKALIFLVGDDRFQVFTLDGLDTRNHY